jgi:MFS superfamily sulfate permease-like transporter
MSDRWVAKETNRERRDSFERVRGQCSRAGLARCVSAGAMARCLSAAVVGERRDRRRDACGLRHPGLARLCDARGVAAAVGHLSSDHAHRGSLVNFISETILLGFKAGAALTIALTQLPKLFGVKGGGEHFFERVAVLGGQLPDTNLAVLAFGLVALAVLLLGERLLPGRPIAQFVVVASIAVLSLTSLRDLGFQVVGALPQGRPAFQSSGLRLHDVDGVIPLAFACVLLAYVESVSAARTLAQANGYEIDARQELLGLGMANLAAAFFQASPVACGLSQSSVNDKAGARTPLALVFASVTIGLCLIYLTGLLGNLPNVVLAAIVLVAVKGLIDVGEMRQWPSSAASPARAASPTGNATRATRPSRVR